MPGVAIEPARAFLPVEVPFHGSFISCLEDPSDNSRWVVFKRACEAIDVEYTGQLKRLRDEHWAVVGFTPTTGNDGKSYEMTIVDLETFGYWLATICSRRIKNDQVRAKIEIYQKGAKAAIARFNSGQHREDRSGVEIPTDPLEVDLLKTQMLARAIQNTIETRKEIGEVREQVKALADHTNAQVEEVRAEMNEVKAALAATPQSNILMPGELTIYMYCKLNRISLTKSQRTAFGRKISSECKAEGISTGGVPWMDEEGNSFVTSSYPVRILDRWKSRFVAMVENSTMRLFKLEDAQGR